MAAINQVGNALTGSSGTGSFAGTTSPSFTTPALGTPSAGVLSSCTGYAQSALTGLGTGVSTALGTNVNGSGAMALTTSPTFVTPVLGASAATSISFGGTALANYVEATFTPSLVSAGGGGVTYTAQAGTYTRIGNKVLFNLSIILSGTTLAAGSVTITGLPIALGSGVQSSYAVYANNLGVTAITQIMAQTGPGLPTSINLYYYAAGSVTALDGTQITATSQFFISGQYTV